MKIAHADLVKQNSILITNFANQHNIAGCVNIIIILCQTIASGEVLTVRVYVMQNNLHCEMQPRLMSEKIILTLSQTTTLVSFALKEFAGDNFEFDKNGRKFSKRVENTVGKGEIARYEQFLLFPQCFQKTCTANT